MDEELNVRLHYAGEFKKTTYVSGKSILVNRVEVDKFSFTVLMEYVKDYLHYSEIGGIYVRKGKRGGWLVTNDSELNEVVKGCDDGEELHFYLDNTVDKDIEPLIQMQPNVIIRPRKNLVQGTYIFVISILLFPIFIYINTKL